MKSTNITTTKNSSLRVIHAQHFNNRRECRPVRFSFIFSRCCYRSIVCCFSASKVLYKNLEMRRKCSRLDHRENWPLWDRAGAQQMVICRIQLGMALAV